MACAIAAAAAAAPAPIGLLYPNGLLLAHTVQRAQAPDQLGAVDADYFTTGKEPGERRAARRNR